MKKFVCMMCLMMITLMTQAVQMMSYSPPEQDVGCPMVATLSLDCNAVVSFDLQLNIVDLQNPVMLNQEASTMSAQVVDAYSLLTPTGEISMTLAYYRWPINKTELANVRKNEPYCCLPNSAVYSFTESLADYI